MEELKIKKITTSEGSITYQNCVLITIPKCGNFAAHRFVVTDMGNENLMDVDIIRRVIGKVIKHYLDYTPENLPVTDDITELNWGRLCVEHSDN